MQKIFKCSEISVKAINRLDFHSSPVGSFSSTPSLASQMVFDERFQLKKFLVTFSLPSLNSSTWSLFEKENPEYMEEIETY